MASVVFANVAWMLLSCLMLQCQVKGEDLQKKKTSEKINCPSGSLSYVSNCYALFLSPKTWMDANFACQKRSQGHLVSVLTASEGFFVASMIRKMGNKHANIWMGLHDPTEGLQPNGNGWEWINHDVLNYRAWEKHNSSTAPGYCGSLSATSNYEQWRDYDCDKLLPYVCKFKN
ncbi:regenerating islet-derived protein 3-gamma-like isoform X1 [Sorex fumeus]|uniref:regenerating islet-derived protein 3-gamma-like isoform X1 n=1 Tax=Sorex fumeus TaxID=62283 RepID=UPI0024ACB144|nr:regenerating islet-derived protein 3-gamma-like isoform X1 [Sorex fumeus]